MYLTKDFDQTIIQSIVFLILILVLFYVYFICMIIVLQIEKKVEIEEINDKMERLRQLHRWKMDKIRNIVDIARGWF